jgi:hypothetical protein
LNERQLTLRLDDAAEGRRGHDRRRLAEPTPSVWAALLAALFALAARLWASGAIADEVLEGDAVYDKRLVEWLHGRATEPFIDPFLGITLFGNSLREAGELEAARAALLALVEERPDDATWTTRRAWAHDALGLESAALPLCERVLELGLHGVRRPGALGLGRTYRAFAATKTPSEAAARARRVPPRRLLRRVPGTLDNLGRHAESMKLTLRRPRGHSTHESIQRYRGRSFLRGQARRIFQ